MDVDFSSSSADDEHRKELGIRHTHWSCFRVRPRPLLDPCFDFLFFSLGRGSISSSGTLSDML